MTRGKAALVTLLDRYDQWGTGASLIEVQKLMYLLQEAGEPLKLRYAAGRYGPYADNLRQVLKQVEGHYLVGFGDGSRTVHDAEPIKVLPHAIAPARDVVAGAADLAERIDRVTRVSEGYGSAYGLELLATVHWAATNGAPHPADVDVDVIVARVVGWDERKSRMFTRDHILAAHERLSSHEWVRSAVAAHEVG